MGETKKQPFQLSFNKFLRVDFQGLRVTSDGGLILVRELDERLGMGPLLRRGFLLLGRLKRFNLWPTRRRERYENSSPSEQA